jgi:CBS domain containing-hemolysin-like protein
LEEQDVDETTPTVRRIFALKNQTARDLMRPMARVMAVSSACTVGEMRTLLRDKYLAFVPIYHKSPVTIVGIAYPRDLLRLGAHKRAREKARSPWFIAENSSILSILKQFRRNNQTVAVVLDSSGGAVGVLTLDEIIDAIFGQADTWVSLEEPEIDIPSVVIDRAFPGEMEVIALNRLYHTTLEENEGETLGEMMRRILGHAPVVGESIKLGALELTAEEVSLLGVKTVSVRTVRR